MAIFAQTKAHKSIQYAHFGGENQKIEKNFRFRFTFY
jgi:hypothetical protein